MKFIADQIIKAAKISLEDGQEKYRKYFVYTPLYADYQEKTNTLLVDQGYGDYIVAA